MHELEKEEIISRIQLLMEKFGEFLEAGTAGLKGIEALAYYDDFPNMFHYNDLGYKERIYVNNEGLITDKWIDDEEKSKDSNAVYYSEGYINDIIEIAANMALLYINATDRNKGAIKLAGKIRELIDNFEDGID